MKALNHKDVIRSYTKFAEYMICLVAATLVCVYFFLKTSSVEIAEIREKTGDSERIFNEQIAISDGFTDIFKTYRSLGISSSTNPDFFMNSIATKKLGVGNMIQNLPEKDVQIHRHILTQMEGFLRTRDSISVLKRTEDVVRNDLIRCNEENRKVTRRLSVGRLSYDKK